MRLVEYGYKPDGSKELPAEYLVRVSSLRNQATVVSPIQEDIQLNVESHWVPLLPHSLLTNANMLVQALTGGRRSFITKATSRRIWVGSSPMKLRLKMRFEAVEDPATEVVYPLYYLSVMALPSQSLKEAPTTEQAAKSGSIGETLGKRLEVLPEAAAKAATLGGVVPLLCPPGPSPFTLAGVLNLRAASSVLPNVVVEGRSIFDHLEGGDKIMVELGKFITFFNVIIKTVDSVVPIKFNFRGLPISATVNVVFETYEMMTVEDFTGCFDVAGNVTEITPGSGVYSPGPPTGGF